jgi:hypothetical protein
MNTRASIDKAARLQIALMVFSLAILLSCGSNEESTENASLPANDDSFTFFDLGKHTKLTDSVRDGLTDKLGRDAIQRRNIIDLEINYNGFLKKYFPELDELNRQLNFPPRERVEHKTVKLMYRYARKINVPFDLVELIFSDYNQKPILFRIQFKEDEANTVEALKEKYGVPQQIAWQNSDGRSLVWKKDGDTLILSYIPNQFGGFDHEIVIYYTANLKQLVITERKEKEARELQREKTGKKAF